MLNLVQVVLDEYEAEPKADADAEQREVQRREESRAERDEQRCRSTKPQRRKGAEAQSLKLAKFRMERGMRKR